MVMVRVRGGVAGADLVEGERTTVALRLDVGPAEIAEDGCSFGDGRYVVVPA